MPYEGPGKRHKATATKDCVHGQLVTEQGYVGTAFKTAQVGSFIDPSAADGGSPSRLLSQKIVAANSEPFELMVGGMHEAPRTGALSSASVGDKVWISPVDNSLLSAPAAGGTNEVQRVAVDATGGTFTLSFDGETTAAISATAAASAVQTALENLSNIAPGDVSVAGGPGNAGATTPYTVTFTGARAGQNVPQMTAAGGSLTGGASTATVSTTTGGATGSASLPVGVVEKIDTVRGIVRINSEDWQAFLPGMA